MQNFVPILEKCALFDGISREDLLSMLDCFCVHIVQCGRNQILFSEGDEAGFVGVVLSGGVQQIKEDFHGNRSIVSRTGSGELFCESFACAGVSTLPVSVEAVEDTVVMLIDSKRITTNCPKACACHSLVIHNLLREVASRNLEYHKKMEITAKRTTRDKLMAYLMAEAKSVGSDSFVIPYDRQGLADYLQVERSAMSTEIGKLRKEGVLLSERNHFTLLRP